MKTEYKKLFELRIKHDFYSDGRSRDFDFVPSEETMNLMKNLRLLWRKDVDGFVVYYQSLVGDTTAFINFSNQIFRFGLVLTNPYFSNITALSPQKNFELTQCIAPPSGGGFELDTVSVVKASIFQYPIQSATRPLRVKLKKGTIIKQDTPIEEAIETVCRIDLTDYNDGSYTIIEETDDVAHTELTSTTIRLDNEVAKLLVNDFRGKPIYGILEIDASDTPVASSYTMSFAAQKSTWEYYLILKSSNTDTFTIEDEGDSKLSFGVATSVPLATINNRIMVPDDSKVLKIATSVTVSFSDHPKTKLKLLRNADTGNPMYLGNPTATSLKTEMFVYL